MAPGRRGTRGLCRGRTARPGRCPRLASEHVARRPLGMGARRRRRRQGGRRWHGRLSGPGVGLRTVPCQGVCVGRGVPLVLDMLSSILFRLGPGVPLPWGWGWGRGLGHKARAGFGFLLSPFIRWESSTDREAQGAGDPGSTVGHWAGSSLLNSLYIWSGGLGAWLWPHSWVLGRGLF